MHKSFRLILLIILLLGNTVVSGQTDTTTGEADTISQQNNQPADQAEKEALAQEGQRLFSNNCASCHQLGSQLIGPDLVGVSERHSDEWLIRFIQNSTAVIESGDPYAVELFEKFNKIPMPPQSLTNDEVMQVLAYIEVEGQKLKGSETAGDQTTAGGGTVSDPTTGGGTGETGGLAGMTYTETLIILGFIILLLAAILFVLLRTRNALSNTLWERDHPGEVKPESRISRQRQVIARYASRLNPTFAVVGVVGIFVVLGGVGFYQQAQWFGSQQGYAPTQPIAFSHKLHAGIMNMDCQYCHTGAAKGKSANIPAVNVCMNCHEYAKQSSDEVQKLRKAYEEGTPIEWVRIHNLPDLAYFNHAQHVNVADVECQTCHGEIEDMEKVSQFSTLEMGWCIDCHKETEIDHENPYYQETFKFLDEHKNLTIAQMGGTECIKCHY